MQIPAVLKEQIREGNVILFLGAGASCGASSADGSSPPIGLQLAELLSDRFLGGEDRESALNVVSEYSISETDILTVQGFIKDLYEKFEPADFHNLIPTFKWAALVTTNYDLIVERAYQKVSAAVQELVPFIKNSDRIEKKLKLENSVAYLKLHGCISRYTDTEVPLILTIDQYVTHKKNRNKLFERFRDFGDEFTVIFVGHRLEDPDLRQIMHEMAESNASRPRYYAVTPSPSERQVRFWETKKITALQGTLKEFLECLNNELDSSLRAIQLPEREHPLEKRFVSRDLRLSQDAVALLNKDSTYITADIRTEEISPDKFYKGYSFGWDAIQKSYDARRDLVDTILSDVILVDEFDRPSIVDLYLIKGHAGSGKTVILKRVAWDAAVEFGKLCVCYGSANAIDPAPILEIIENTDERLFLFVDRASGHVNDLRVLITTAAKRQAKLTIVVAERTNEWNMDCESLGKYLDEVYDVKYLKAGEINLLLEKLAHNKSLGLLRDLSEQERVDAFEKKAGRQILVALHEATSGKPFEEIICDEYRNIEPVAARKMYQTICVMSRLDVPVRAGIIKRVHGISFEDFKEKFFSPLESVVFSRKGNGYHDSSYVARHPRIAEIIFEQTLPDQQDRLDIYLRLLDALDIGYDADRKAYRSLIKAKELIRLFSDPKMVRKIYDAAKQSAGEEPYFHQQKAIYEMRRDNPNYDLAYEELRLAEELAPYDRSIKHSLAELELLRANASGSEIEREKHTSAAVRIAASLTGIGAEGSYGYHTLVKIHLARLEKQLFEAPEDDQLVAELVKSAESEIRAALQIFPDDEYLLTSESELAKMLNADARAVSALERAFKVNSMSPFLAKGLSRLYEEQKDYAKARSVLERCLEGLPGDKSINAALAQLLVSYYSDESERAEYYWRRSFTDGDTNYHCQFWYARQLYLNDKKEDYKQRIEKLKKVALAPEVKQKIRGPIKGANGEPKRFRGKIERLEEVYAFVSLETGGDWVFLHRSNYANGWESLKRGLPIQFNIGFTYRGLGAFNVEMLQM